MRTGAILLRVSSIGQAEEGMASYPMQLRDCLAYADTNNINVPADLTWQEVGKRDQYYTRDGLQAALAAAKEGKYQVLIVWRMDRLTDDPGRLLRIIEDLEKMGVTVGYATEPDTNTDTELGRWLAYTKALFQVQPERKTLALRTKTARRMYTEQGRPYATRLPRYGYKWVVDWSHGHTVKRGGIEVPLKEKLEPDPETAPVTQQIYNWADAGKTLDWICRALSGKEEGGIYKKPTPRQYANTNGANPNGEWEESTINRILEFPGYMGKWPAYRTKRVPRNDGSERIRHEPVPKDEWLWIEPSPAPALVTEAQWSRVQTRLANNKLYAARNRAHHLGLQHALLQRGMARCGAIRPDGTICNGPMDARPRSHRFDYPDGSRSYQYFCRETKRNFPECKGVYCLTETLDRAVQSALVKLLRDPETLRRLAKRDQDRDRAGEEGVVIITPADEYEALKKKLAAKERELTNLMLQRAEYEPGDPRLLGFELGMQVLSAKVQDLRDECEQARRNAEKYQRREKTIMQWEDYITVAQDNVEVLGDPLTLSHPTIRRKHRNWLEALGARVILHPYGTPGKFATLQLHLSQLDFGAKPISTGDAPIELAVVPTNPEPLRHGGLTPDEPGYRPYWLRPDYDEETDSAPRDDRPLEDWNEPETPEQRAARVASNHGWTLEEALQYCAECDRMREEAATLPVAERTEFYLRQSLTHPRHWIAEYRQRQPSLPKPTPEEDSVVSRSRRCNTPGRGWKPAGHGPPRTR
jgi:DNA invertase Pin-like site-specific DNA recombinase